MFNPEDLRLTEDRVLLETDPAETMSAGGILLPNGKVKNFHATVKKIGPGLKLKDGSRAEMSVAPGDRVVFQKHAGNQLKYVGDNLLIVAERDILALVGEKSTPKIEVQYVSIDEELKRDDLSPIKREVLTKMQQAPRHITGAKHERT